VRIVRTDPPQDYFPPNEEEIKRAAERCGLKSYSPHLVADLCNIEAGGSFRSIIDQREAIREEAELKIVRAGSYFQDMEGNRHNQKDEAFKKNMNAVVNANERINDFVKEIVEAPVPGMSPLYRSINILKALSMQKDNQSEDGQNGESIPSFKPGEAEKLSKEMKDLFETVVNLSPEERKLLEEGGEEEIDPDLKSMKIYEDMRESDKKVWLKISRQLDSLSSMKAQHSVKVEANVEGDDVQVRPIRDLGEIHRLQKIEWTYPKILRNIRIMTNTAMVRERVDRIYEKQLLYMLIDVSGSMESGQRIPIAGGVVMNRLRAVCQNEAEIFMRTFDTGVYPEHSARNPEEAYALMEKFKKTNFSGGGTNITGAVEKALSSIEKKMHNDPTLVRPEIVVVSDGGSSIGINKARMGETRIHAIIIQGHNDDLKRLCKSTGGIFMEVNETIA